MLGKIRGAQLVDQKKITVEGYPAREYSVTTPKGPVRMRTILVKPRFYELMAGGAPDKVSDKDVQAFFDSFKLTGK
jgi:hypothetical protein